MTPSITWCGHSAVRLILADEREIWIDPWLKDNPTCPAALKEPARCDLVVITHGHADHVGDVGALIKRFNPPVVANYDLCSALQHHLGAGRYLGMNTGGTQEVEGIRISMTRAYHSSAVETAGGPVYGGMPNGVVIEAAHLASVYHAGDTDVFGDMALIARLFRPRIAMLPIGDLYTMGAAGAALAADLLDPAVILPIHYKTFPVLAANPDAFHLALPPRLKDRLKTPREGEALRWTSSGVGREC